MSYESQINTYLGLRWVWVEVLLIDGDLAEASLDLAKSHSGGGGVMEGLGSELQCSAVVERRRRKIEV